jgi:hypothetical protein
MLSREIAYMVQLLMTQHDANQTLKNIILTLKNKSDKQNKTNKINMKFKDEISYIVKLL